MRKTLAVLLTMFVMLTMLAAPAIAQEELTIENIKIGFIHIGDSSDMGYTAAHDRGTQKMKADLGLRDDQIINKYNIPESSVCADALLELVEDECDIIFVTSFGHESYVVAAADENPDIEFCHATGFQAAGAGLDNFHNYFGKIYEARYLSGIAAGLKAKEIGNNMLGYVAAMPFAECISGFTAFYLGAKSVNPDVTMKVMYTANNNWNDPVREGQLATALVDAGCGVISQHCDSTAPATVSQSKGTFHVGYNTDTVAVAPDATLCSTVWDWSIYLKYAVNCVLAGEAIATDWCGNFEDGMCGVSPLNEAIAAAGTAEAIEEAGKKIISGEIQVFAGPLSGTASDGSTIEIAEGDHYPESETASAPSWGYIIDGIEVVGE